MTLTVCPLSNLKLCVVDDLKAHPLKRMLELGLQRHDQLRRPGLFRRLPGRELDRRPRAALDLSRDELVTLAKNSFTGSFLTPAEIAPHLAAIDAYAAANA